MLIKGTKSTREREHEYFKTGELDNLLLTPNERKKSLYAPQRTEVFEERPFEVLEAKRDENKSLYDITKAQPVTGF